MKKLDEITYEDWKVMDPFSYWIVETGSIQVSSNSLDLILTEQGGARVSLPFYISSGRVTVSLRPPQPRMASGVVSSFILMSNLRDELDWEFLGKAEGAESNWYYKGVLDYTRGRVHSCPDSTCSASYAFSYSKQETEWLIDGQIVRVLNTSTDSSSSVSSRPASSLSVMNPNASTLMQRPEDAMRIMLSIWSASAPYQPEGVREWAGVTHWSQGPFILGIESLRVECLDPASYGEASSASLLSAGPVALLMLCYVLYA